MDYKVRYRFENVRKNFKLTHDNFSCVMFSNMGDSPAEVQNIILQPGESVSFNEDPTVYIETDFVIKFFQDLISDNPLIVITCSYYERIKHC